MNTPTSAMMPQTSEARGLLYRRCGPDCFGVSVAVPTLVRPNLRS
jgi:hypothetical protein